MTLSYILCTLAHIYVLNVCAHLNISNIICVICCQNNNCMHKYYYNSQRHCHLFIKLHSLMTEFKAGMQVCMQRIAVCVSYTSHT